MCAPVGKESLRHRYAMPPPFNKGGYPPGSWLPVILPQGKAVLRNGRIISAPTVGMAGFVKNNVGATLAVARYEGIPLSFRS